MAASAPKPLAAHALHAPPVAPSGLASTRWAALAGLLTVCLLPVAARADDAEALPSPLRLEDVVRLAKERRAEVVAAQARARALAARPALVSALDDPTISPSVDHLPFMLGGADVSLTVEQRFPLSGVLGNRRRSAEEDARREQAVAGKVALDVALDAASAFLMVQERREMARILEVQRALAGQLVRAATARYASGAGTQADALRAETERARLDGERRSVAAEVRGAEVMLNTSLGRSPLAPVPPLEGKPPDAVPPDAEAVRAAAVEGRPELGAGAAEVRRAEADVAAMQSMYWPMAMVRTGPAYTMTDGPGWMAMVGVSVPLWRGRLAAGVDEARAMAEMASADLLAMRRMVVGEALAAREGVVGARERYVALRDEVLPRSQEAVDAALAGYSSGLLPLVSVVEAARALWAAQGEVVSAQHDLGLAWARLRRATGNQGANP